MGEFEVACRRVAEPDAGWAEQAREHHRRLTKPPGSLGSLEDVGVRLAAISGRIPPPVPHPAVVAVFAADHGVVAEHVTPWPQEVTVQMVGNFLAGGAAVNALARQADAQVLVVDVGVAATLEPAPGLLDRKVRRGTANLCVEDAMSLDEALAALDVGASVAAHLVDEGYRCLVAGDMGIGNTTASAALVAALIGLPPADVTGRGSGVDDAGLRRKIEVVEAALERKGPLLDPLRVLASVGGLEIAALAGFCVGAAAAGVPVVVDGLISSAGLLVAHAMRPGVIAYAFAGHRSTEPGASAVLEHLGLHPLLDLELRLGEGSGALLALPLVQAAARVMGEMATFDSAGVSGKSV